MRFQFAFRNMESEAPVINYIKEGLHQKIEKYLHEVAEVNIVIKKHRFEYKITCSLVSEDGFSTHTNMRGKNLHNTVDQLLEKIGSQAAKRKQFMKDHQNHYKMRQHDSKLNKIYQLDVKTDTVDAEEIIQYERTQSRLRKAS